METIGKYEIVRRLGAGALGEVYEVRTATGARGVLRACASPDPALRERFAATAERLRGLVAPTIAIVFDSGVENGTPFLVEEFLSGEPLDRRLERGAPFSLQEGMALLFQLAQALKAAEAAGFAHRDLRPAHVRLIGESRIKVQGFGIALLARGADGHPPRSGDAPEEIAYVAPEQIRGEAPDGRSDQFSFGVMAYELLSGRRPFGGEHAADLMVQILSSEPIALGDRSPDCPQAMARIVARCLEKDPARRLQRASDLVAAIAPLVDVVSEGPRQVTRVLEPNELQPESPNPAARRSEARARIAQHLLRGELAQAEASLREAERAAPGAAGAYADLRGRLAELRDAERRTQVKSLLDSARRFFDEGDLDLAQRACVEALTLEPSEAEAHRLLADTQQALAEQRHEDELETSRTIARAAVAELLATPERESGEVAPRRSGAAAPPSAAVDDDDTAVSLESTLAGPELAALEVPPAIAVTDAEWPQLPPSQALSTLPELPELPEPLAPPVLPGVPQARSADAQIARSADAQTTRSADAQTARSADAQTTRSADAQAARSAEAPIAPRTEAPAAPSSSSAPLALPPPAAQRIARIETMLGNGALHDARVAIEELKSEIRGNPLVRDEHARLSTALLDAFQMQRRGRPSGAPPPLDAPGSRARVTATPPAVRLPSPPAPAAAAPPSSTAAPAAAPPAMPVAPSPVAVRPPGKAGLWAALAGLVLVVLLAAAGSLWWWSQRAPAAPTALPPLAPAVRPARLTVPPNTLAGATVRVDGGPPTPLVAGLVREVPPGAHVLIFEAPGSTPQEVRLELGSGEARTQSTPFLMPLPPVEPEPEPAAAPVKPKRPKPVVVPAAPEPAVEEPAPPPAPAPPPTARGDLVEAGPGVVAPRTLSIPGAKYPERARREKREATIGVLVLVDENGQPSQVKTQDGDPYGVGFDEAALTAVRAARFEPATKDGVQVKMWKLVRVGFRLK